MVPVFTMAGMKIRVPAQAAGGKAEDGPVDMRPWFLSIDACVKSYQKASGADGAQGVDADAAARAAESASLHLATLDELAAAMMTESPVDFRKMIFMPSESVCLQGPGRGVGAYKRARLLQTSLKASPAPRLHLVNARFCISIALSPLST